jgi:hypothetical protein
MSAILHIALFRIPLLVQIDFVFNLTAVERLVDGAKKYSSITQTHLAFDLISTPPSSRAKIFIDCGALIHGYNISKEYIRVRIYRQFLL